MLNIILHIPAIISRYFKPFKKVFSDKMAGICLHYMAGLFMEYKRFNLKQLAIKAPDYPYQSYQYLITEAKWDEKELNRQRIQEIQSRKQTRSRKDGVLILDDTSNKKSKNCKSTDSVGWQYSSKDDASVNCQVSVYSAYADHKKAFPVDFKPYWPEDAYFRTKRKDVVFKSKLDLGIELVEEAIARGIKFSHIVYDSWYLSNDTAKYYQDNGKKFISEVDSNRWVLYLGQWHKAGELVKLAGENNLCLKATRIKTPKGEKVYFYRSWIGKLKGIPLQLRFILSRGEDKDGTITYKLLVTNDLKSPDKIIIEKYNLRWSIEVIFERLKEYFYLDQFQVRSEKAFSRHYYLAMLAYSFILVHLKCGSFAKLTAKAPKTFDQAIKLIRDLVTLQSCNELNQNVRIALYNKDLRLKSLPAVI